MKSLVFKITREKLEVKKVAILFLCDIFNFSDVRSGCLLHKTNLGAIQKVLSLRREGGGEVNEKRSKTNKGGSQHVCTFALFKKKMLWFSKWSFIVILQFFLLIIIAVSNIKPSWKIIIFGPVNEWRAIAFGSPFYFAHLFVLVSALFIITLCIFSKNGYLFTRYR